MQRDILKALELSVLYNVKSPQSIDKYIDELVYKPKWSIKKLIDNCAVNIMNGFPRLYKFFLSIGINRLYNYFK